jgi:maltose alpha-D-glucosyltransferase/alpha-amylase
MGDLYQQLALFRTQHPALRNGAYQPLPCDDRAVLAFLRATTGDSVLCVFNFSGERRSATVHLPALASAGLRMMGAEGRLTVGVDGLLDLNLSPRGFVLAAKER